MNAGITDEPVTVIDYIRLVDEAGMKNSEGSRTFAMLSYPKESFRISGIPKGDTDALVANILERYKDGILLDADKQISLICNWAHAQDIDAKELLHAVSLAVIRLDDSASEFQTRTMVNIEVALFRMDRTESVE